VQLSDSLKVKCWCNLTRAMIASSTAQQQQAHQFSASKAMLKILMLQIINMFSASIH